MGVSAVIFLLIFATIVYYSLHQANKDIGNTVEAQFKYTSSLINEDYKCTEVSASNFMSILESPIVKHTPEGVYNTCRYFLNSNDGVSGIAVGYEPNVMDNNLNGFAPYLCRHGDTLRTANLADKQDFRSRPWYRETYLSDEPQWFAPYMSIYGEVITSYTVPVKSSDGKTVGVAAFDLSLSDLSDSLDSRKPYPNAKLYVVDDDGTFVAHPVKDSILVASMPQSLLEDIKKGNFTFKEDGVRQFAFASQDSLTGWYIVMTVPKSDLTEDLESMVNFLIFYMIAGILLLVLICYEVIMRLTKPLETFASAAQEISHGKFHTDLPVIKDHNELYDLRQALASMEVSLDEYIKELEETSSKKAKIENELSIARSIQMAMVNKIFPPYPERKDLDLYASLTPAQAVGGDLYDFVLVGDTLHFCIGDVSGKGVPASLFMAITRALYRNTACTGKTPAQIATTLNEAISDNNSQSMFVTMFIGTCDLNTGLFTCCNCGHNAPVTNGRFKKGSRTEISATDEPHYLGGVPNNIPIGVFKGFKFREASMKIDPGTSMLLYTDGITEAENIKHELFGEDRLIQTMNKVSNATASEQIINTIISDVKGFTKEAQQSDDITMLCLRYIGQSDKS